MTNGVKYQFTNKPWRYDGPNGWCFISLPEEMSKDIRAHFKQDEEGWGRLKATAKVGNSEWKTAIWFDTKVNTYLLPLKATIRQKEKVELDKHLTVSLWI
ncbi:MAG: DUF1905 domain-containing protein [Bacteroidetes bacterium]|nr:DUF1905 domain-containing protein [Bacteroidota bacterium]